LKTHCKWDSHKRCQIWASEGYCRDEWERNEKYAKLKCPLSCIYEIPTNCTDLASQGNCDKSDTGSWMQTNCPRACHDVDCPCQEPEVSCQDWATDGYCYSQGDKGQRQWMQDNCPISCKFCRLTNHKQTATTTTTASQTECPLNTDENCKDWASKGLCLDKFHDNYKIVQAKCPRSCSTGDLTTTCPCKDLEVSCGAWASDGYCFSKGTQAQQKWMKNNCQQSCKLC